MDGHNVSSRDRGDAAIADYDVPGTSGALLTADLLAVVSLVVKIDVKRM